MNGTLRVVQTGPFACVQDLGRTGYADIGVGRSGAADRGALRLANRLVGNEEDAAGIEVLLGGLRIRAHEPLLIAATGAIGDVQVDDRLFAPNTAVALPAGAQLSLGLATAGLRRYVGIRGGIAIDPVLGSRATDTFAGIGPPALAAGTLLAVGPPRHPVPDTDLAAVAAPANGEAALHVLPGPRADWFADGALCTGRYEVSADSDRVAVRLTGTPITRRVERELPSEGLVSGAIQVPPDGQPLIFLADHPVTGGYPVIGVLTEPDRDRAAQLRPGQPVRFHS